MGKKTPTNYYVDPKQLKHEVVLYKQTGVISEPLGLILINIANRFATKPNFSGYTYKEDFIGDAILRMCEQLYKLDEKFSGTQMFSYLTQIVYWKFCHKINMETRYAKTKEDYRDKVFDQIEHEEGIKFKDNPDDNDLNLNDPELLT